MNTTAKAPEHVLADLGVTDRPNLIAQTSDGAHWLTAYADDGQPAEFCIEWVEAVEVIVGSRGLAGLEGGPSVDVERTDRHLYGVFADLPDALNAVYADPSRDRSADAYVTLDLSAWAIRYRRSVVAA